MSPSPRILNSPLIRTNICLESSSRLGLDVGACMTHTSEVLDAYAQMPATTKRHQRG
uniref:Uncharacterized protein n=1 Tax=Mesocestoides corti TaxID=53468 RepID=A0A5K3G6G9_MESCO